MPGFVEAHAHTQEGAMWRFPYVGYFDRADADGNVHPSRTSLDEVAAALRELDAGMTDPSEPLIAWGFDPIYFPGEPRPAAADLDRASTTRPIFLLHASGHVATVNTAMLQASDITAETQTDGVVKDAAGRPTGELDEGTAMMLATPAAFLVLETGTDPEGFWRYARLARNAGHTTVTDLGGPVFLDPEAANSIAQVTNHPDFPVRLVQYGWAEPPGKSGEPKAVIARYRELKATETDKLRFGGVKFVADGSIQGFTANLAWPGYFTGDDHGLWTVDTETFPKKVRAFHEAGINIHIHCNGDETVDAGIAAIEFALLQHAWLNHRHTIQHSQLTTAAQYRRMANSRICANLFANHIWYWGDQHYELTLGPERANRIEACATAKREGVHFSIHSDANVTPIGHLHTMWCVVNRVTPKGRVLGPEERISAYDALYAATVDAAYQLHLDHEIGTIEVGKRADFAVLEESPLDVDPMAIKDIRVWGTVLSGVKFEAGQALGP